ncbi:hypothetical protein ES708_28930 [subsurface metagenome]
MNKLRKEKIILLVLVVIIAILVIYNIFSVEMQKIETKKQLEESARLEEERARMEREMLEEIRSREAKEMAEYYQKYRPLKAEFIEEAAYLSEKMKDKIINIEQLIELTTRRLNAARDYREKLIQVGNVPESLETFFSYEMEFLESDIKTVNIVLSYYNSESYSDFNSNAIKKLYENTRSMLLKAGEELQRVYSQYELEYLLEESS